MLDIGALVLPPVRRELPVAVQAGLFVGSWFPRIIASEEHQPCPLRPSI
jgi:hypothetical protein